MAAKRYVCGNSKCKGYQGGTSKICRFCGSKAKRTRRA